MCIIFPWVFNGHSDENEMGRLVVRFQEEGREWRLSYLLYADDLDLCGELEEGLRALMGLFIEVCRRRGLKVNTGVR